MARQPNKLNQDSKEDQMISVPFDEQVARGVITNMSLVRKFGRNKDIDTAAIEFIGLQGGAHVNMAIPTQVTIVSDSVDDINTGANAEIVTVYGLDANYALQEETLAMNATTAVVGLLTFAFIYRARVTQSNAGANDAFNSGVITITDSTSTILQIDAGENSSFHAAYQVPAGKYALILDWWGTMNKGSGATAHVDVGLIIKPDGLPPLLMGNIGLSEDGTSDFDHGERGIIKVDAKGIIYLTGAASVNNIDISAGFDLHLYDVTD